MASKDVWLSVANVDTVLARSGDLVARGGGGALGECKEGVNARHMNGMESRGWERKVLCQRKKHTEKKKNCSE